MLSKFFDLFNRVITAAVKCPRPGCTGNLVLRKNKKTNQEFYGCSNYFAPPPQQCSTSVSVAEYRDMEQEQRGERPVQAPVGGARPAEKPVAPKVDQQGQHFWVLATMLDTNDPVVVTKAHKDLGDFWHYKKRDGDIGVFPNKDIAKKIKSVLDEKGEKITGQRPEELFAKYDVINAVGKEDVAEKQEEKPVEKKKQEPSPYQVAILSDYKDTQKNIMVNALAGTGKTTTLLQLAKLRKPGEKWIYVVFNKKNQVEGERKFKPFGIPVYTVHSYLNTILKKGAEQGSIQYTTDFLPEDIRRKNKELRKNQQFLIEQKLWKIVDKSMAEVAAENPGDAIPKNHLYEKGKYFIRKLTSLAQAYSVAPDDASTEKVLQILHEHNIPPKLYTQEEAAKARMNYGALVDYSLYMAASASRALYYLLPENCPPELKEYEQYRSFDDTLWFASINNNLDFSGYDVALVDEVQDFNLCQINMLKKMSDAGTRIIAVGDPYQSIYRFRGADSKSFNRVAEVLHAAPLGGTTHALPINYRSGKAIIEFVRNNTHVKDIVAGLDHEGSVEEGIEYDSALKKLGKEMKANNRLEEETAILARTNAPLACAAVNLLKAGVDFEIVGTEFAKEAQEFLKECGLTDRMLIGDIYPTIEREVIQFVEENRLKAALANDCKYMEDWGSALKGILTWLDSKGLKDPKVGIYKIENVYDFKNYLYRKFASSEYADAGDKFNKGKDKKSFVTLTTAHRSKGLEFDRVIIAEPGGFPSPLAKSKEDIEQEQNAWYVALTRAKNKLILLEERPKKYEYKEAKNMNNIGWYKKAQMLTPQQMQQYVDFKTPGAVKLIGSGMGATFNIPGIGVSIPGGKLMNQVLMKIQPVLTKNNVHTIDTSPVSRADAIGLAVSSKPGVIHVDINKILKSIQNQALPSVSQLDGAKIDQDVKNNIINRVSSYIMNQLAETAAHEGAHMRDYFATFPKGQFQSSESGAESYGRGVAQQYFRIQP